MGLYEGKVAVVTGAASGIGKAIVAGLLAEGAKVMAADYNEAGLKELDRDMGSAPGGARLTTVAYDASRPEDATKLVEAATQAYGAVDVVFANAGIFDGFAPLAATDEALWDRVLTVNLKGYFLLAKAALPALLERRGALVLTASTAGLEASQGGLAYTAAKHGVVGLTRELAYELAPKGVRVNAVCPGGTDTGLGMTEGQPSVFTPEILALVDATTPMRRHGRPEDAANAAIFLGSERAAHITGELLRVDGGYGVKGFPYPEEQA